MLNYSADINICVDYTLEVLLGKDYRNYFRDTKVVYGKPEANTGNIGALYIIPSGFFGDNYGKENTLPKLPLKEIEGVPILYGAPVIESSNRQLIVHADIIASAYFLVTRYDELVRYNTRDGYGRFPGKQSLPYRAGFIHRPIVEEYAALLHGWLRQIGLNLPEPKRNFSILLSHDVDILRKCQSARRFLCATAGAFGGRYPLKTVAENVAAFFGKSKDPYDTFDELISLDSSVENHSVYFFMASSGHCYKIRGENAGKALKRVIDSGASVGLHLSCEAGIKPELIIREKAELEEVCGFTINRNRYHFLAWREVEDGWALAKAGINWDSTMGYPDVAGFRLGVCHPIPLFDPIQMKPFGIEEHPLIVMDGTLYNQAYMNLGENQSLQYCKQLIAATQKYKGEFVILWHNSAPVTMDGKLHLKLYQQILTEAGLEQTRFKNVETIRV